MAVIISGIIDQTAAAAELERMMDSVSPARPGHEGLSGASRGGNRGRETKRMGSWRSWDVFLCIAGGGLQAVVQRHFSRI